MALIISKFMKKVVKDAPVSKRSSSGNLLTLAAPLMRKSESEQIGQGGVNIMGSILASLQREEKQEN